MICFYPIKFSKNAENLYEYFLFVFSVLKAEILNIPGIKNNPNGTNKDIIKLIPESLRRCICVFIYTPQKQVI